MFKSFLKFLSPWLKTNPIETKTTLVKTNTDDPPPIISPAHIAYKIPARKLNYLLNTYGFFVKIKWYERYKSDLDSVQEFDDLLSLDGFDIDDYYMNIDAKRKALIGIQFEFREDDIPLDELRISQVYYVKESNKFYKYWLSEDNSLTHLGFDKMYEIREPNDQTDHFHLSEDPINGDYKNLDFFPSNGEIDFVYFTIDQIKEITKFYTDEKGYVIISGCQLDYGKKLYHPENSELKNYKNPYFTLKIEGEINPNVPYDPTVSTTLGSGSAGLRIASSTQEDDLDLDPSATGETQDAAIAIGQPCPPVWQSFAQQELQAINLNPELVNDIEALNFLKLNWGKTAVEWETVNTWPVNEIDSGS